jgi:retron-type reverse transcriptase
MSEETTTPQSENLGEDSAKDLTTAKNWRETLREMGKTAFQRHEIERLGFWPLNEKMRQENAATEAELTQLREELTPMRREIHRLQKEISAASNVQALLNEIRRKRIERVKAERIIKKAERAKQLEQKAADYQKWRGETLPHLGRGVSQGLKYEAGDDEKLTRLGLPLLHSAQDVAQTLEIETKTLAWLTYHRGADFVDHYHHFTIPKKRGGRREISSPKTKLRVAQNWLLENVLNKIEIHEAAMAFRPGRSINDNAAQHMARSIVIRVDLKDFFPSVGFKRVKRVYENFGYNEGVASIFALLSTEAPRVAMNFDGKKYHVAIGDRALPQGACTSPALTNILCKNLDARLTGICEKLGFTYTRYADDLVFSTDNTEGDPVSQILHWARKIIRECGFEINDEKLLVMRKGQRQAVTGLVVNAQDADGPRLSRRDLKKFRAFLHHYERFGREAMTEKIGRDSLSYARGYLSFIHMVKPEHAERLQSAHPWLERK